MAEVGGIRTCTKTAERGLARERGEVLCQRQAFALGADRKIGSNISNCGWLLA